MDNSRLCFLIDELKISNKDLAELSGYSISTISRIKNNKRQLNSASEASASLVNALIKYAEINYNYSIIEDILNDYNCDIPLFYRLSNWLFDSPNKYDTEKKSFTSFGKHLTLSMQIAEISNSALARSLNLDPSSISRFRKGHRIPKSNPQLVRKLCDVLLDEIIKHNKLHKLTALIGGSVNTCCDISEISTQFKDWLCDFTPDIAISINGFIKSLDSWNPQILSNLIPQNVSIPELNYEISNTYQGHSGLQNAVLRFLTDAVVSNSKRLYLYSDEKLSWLTADSDFQKLWKQLMIACIQKKIHIYIIHNIDRGLPEMLDAIKSWVPLYMSGMIESYYNKSSNGTRFAHTFFLCPDVACIESFYSSGMNQALYNYHTEEPHLTFFYKCYVNMLHYCNPLITLRPEPLASNTAETIISNSFYEHIQITLTEKDVIVSRIDNPDLSFVVSHPLLYNAFRKFIL